jgi:hypothetical protein
MKFPIHTALICCALASSGLASAGPGAHGPNGEHLDGPAPVLSAGASVPRVEAKSESFELVARIEAGAFSILIDRYDTNEPVLDAQVEVEVGPRKQKAVFRREQGDYFVADPALVKLLSSAGSHTLVFTVNAGKESDLLDATMSVSDAGTGNGAGHAPYTSIAALIGGGVLVVGAAGAFMRRRRAARTIGFPGGTR